MTRRRAKAKKLNEMEKHEMKYDDIGMTESLRDFDDTVFPSLSGRMQMKFD